MPIVDIFDKIESAFASSNTRPIQVDARSLSYKARKNLPDSSFVFKRQRKYPIHDIRHARNALARASAYGSPKVKHAVYRAVFNKYPALHDKHSHLMEYLKRSKHSVHSHIMEIAKPGEQHYHLLGPEEYAQKVKAAHEGDNKCCQQLANHHWVHVNHNETMGNVHSKMGRDNLAMAHHHLAGINTHIASHYDQSLDPKTHAIVNKS